MYKALKDLDNFIDNGDLPFYEEKMLRSISYDVEQTIMTLDNLVEELYKDLSGIAKPVADVWRKSRPEIFDRYENNDER